MYHARKRIWQTTQVSPMCMFFSHKPTIRPMDQKQVCWRDHRLTWQLFATTTKLALFFYHSLWAEVQLGAEVMHGFRQNWTRYGKTQKSSKKHILIKNTTHFDLVCREQFGAVFSLHYRPYHIIWIRSYEVLSGFKSTPEEIISTCTFLVIFSLFTEDFCQS